MILKKIEIKGFRNIDNECLIPENNMNVICGDNAQGKTNIVEAIWMLSGAKSFRGAKDKELIKRENDFSLINADIFSGGIDKKISLEIKEKRTAALNDKKLSSAAELSEHFSAIVFSPSDIALAAGAPAIRRRFLDTAICQIYPSYIELLKNYTRAVTQRNIILKDCYRDAAKRIFLEDFENEIIKYGEKIYEYRKKYISLMLNFAPDIYNDLSGKKEIFEVEYIYSGGENIKAELKNNRTEDMLRGITSVGPHRDDILFKINGFSSREYSSQGQKRSIALAAKLSSAAILKQITGEQPIALLDDVMSELDKGRQNYILNHIDGWQVFITCCEDSHFENLKKGKIFKIKDGRAE